MFLYSPSRLERIGKLQRFQLASLLASQCSGRNEVAALPVWAEKRRERKEGQVEVRGEGKERVSTREERSCGAQAQSALPKHTASLRGKQIGEGKGGAKTI